MFELFSFMHPYCYDEIHIILRITDSGRYSDSPISGSNRFARKFYSNLYKSIRKPTTLVERN